MRLSKGSTAGRLAISTAAILAVPLMGCNPAAGPGTLEGRVSWNGSAVAGALVQAYARADRDPDTAPVAEAPSAGDGSYRLELPAGRYWVWARATVDDRGRDRRVVGQVPDNPVEVAAGHTSRSDVALADPSGFTAQAGPPGTGAGGRVSGAPAPEVTVYAYRGLAERPTGPGFVATASPDPTGAFRLDLPAGRYTLSARWRASGEPFGAVEPGDRVGTTRVDVARGRYADAGTIRLEPVDPERWHRTRRASPMSGTWVAGRVVEDGRPAAGVRVLAFTDPRMAGRPAALSEPTGPDGRFRVYLPGGGTYHLGARSRVGGPAQPGERAGTYRGEDGAGLRVAPGGRVDGVTIAVEEVW